MLTLGLHKRITEEEIGSHGPTDLAVWLFFQIAAGHIALPILTATFILARTVTKIPALIVVCLTWILSAVFSTLLFYVGEHTGPEPGKGLCIAQASLLGGTPLMTCSAAILLAIYVWKTYDDPDLGVDMQPRTRTGKLGKIALHCSPFFILGLFVAIAVSIALKHPERATRTQEYFYCSLDWPPFTEAVSIISTLLCIVAMGIEIHVVVTAIQYWGLLRRGGHLTDESVRFILRAVAFTCFLLASTLINLASIWISIGVLPDMLSASVGMALFLLFASRYEIFHAWAFWKRLPTLPSESHGPRDSLPILHTRFQGSDSGMPSLSSQYTLGSAPSSQALFMKERPGVYPAQIQVHPSQSSVPHSYTVQNGGVQIIERPEDAFIRHAASAGSRGPRRHHDTRRDTISTWGF